MLRMILLALAAALGSACVVNIPASWFGSSSSSFELDGVKIHYDDGVFEIDGVELEHDRWISLGGTLDAASTKLQVLTATGSIDVEASEDRAYALDVHLYSEIEGDGEVLFEHGRLVARSAGGHKLLVNEVRGRAPDGLDARFESGMGHVVVRGFSGPRMDIDTGMGDVDATSLRVSELVIGAGMEL